MSPEDEASIREGAAIIASLGMTTAEAAEGARQLVERIGGTLDDAPE